MSGSGLMKLRFIEVYNCGRYFFGQKNTRTKGDIGIEGLVETNHLFFYSFVYKYKNMSVVNCFFRQKNTRTKERYGNRELGRNKFYVLLFFCLQIIKTCLSRTVFFDKRTQGQKGIWKWFGINKSYVLLFLCLKIMEICLL